MADEQAKIDANSRASLTGQDEVSGEIRRVQTDANGAIKVVIDSLTASFLDLSDTPSSYSGQAGLVVTVNGTEDGLIFQAAAGGVTGPGSSTDNAIVRWDGTGGDTVQNSGITISDTDDIAGVNNVTGIDTNFVTGTAGTSGDLSVWNADGDLVDGPTPPTGTIVGTSDTQTLTNKTLTTPVISQISNTGTLTLPTSTDTLVGRDTTDTLTNKTLTTPTIGDFSNATHNHTNAAGGGQLTDAALSSAVTVPKGGTGLTSLTEYAILAGGTTTTGNVQQVSGVGTSGQVLTSNGAAALPTWQDASGGGAAQRNLNIQFNATNMQTSGTVADDTSNNGLNIQNSGASGSGAYASASMNGGGTADFDFYDRNPEFSVTTDILAGQATGDGLYYAGFWGGVTPTLTQTNKSAMVIYDVASGTGTYYLQNADGTTNTNTSFTGVTATDTNNFRVALDSGTNVKCWANYTLKATNTTNLPAGDLPDSNFFAVGLDNDAGDTTSRTIEAGFAEVLIDQMT